MSDREHITAGERSDRPADRVRARLLRGLDACIPRRVREEGGDAVLRTRLVLTAGALGFVASVLSSFREHVVPEWNWMSPLLAVTYLPLPFLLRRSHALAANYLIALSFASVVGLVAATGGASQATLFSTILIPPAAVLLCGFRAGGLWSLGTAAAVAVVWALDAGGYRFPVEAVALPERDLRFFATLYLLVPIAVLSLTYEWLNRRAVTRVERANAELLRQSSRQEAVASVGVFALAAPDSRPAVDAVLRTFVQHLDLRGAEMVRFGDRPEIERVASCGEVPEDVAEAATHVGRVVAAGRPVTYPIRGEGIVAVADAVTGSELTWGVMVGYRESPVAPCSADRHFVRSLCNLVAVVWDREAQAAREAAARTELELARQLQSIGQLAAGIAHEINTPAQYVGDNVRFLKEGFGHLTGLVARWQEALERPELSREELAKAREEADLDWLLEEIPQALDQSDEGVRRVSEIVQAMRQFSHPGQDGKAPTDLNEALRTTATVSRNEWKYVADLELELDPSLPLVQCEAGHMNQVFLNLVVNAAQAMPPARGQGEPKGRITIRTGHDADQVWIEVADDGVGIPETIRTRVFDPFFTTKDPGKGTGQGLAITRSYVVERHGGRIGVESEPGRGSTFRIELPVSPAAPLEEPA